MGHLETALTGIEALSKRIQKTNITIYINKLRL